MVKNKDRWSALSMKDRAALIDIYVKSGITDLGEIRKDYNSFNYGGDTEPLYYDDTYIEPAVVKAFNSKEEYNRWKGEQGAAAVREGTNKVAQGIYNGLFLTPVLGDVLDVTDAAIEAKEGNWKNAAVLAGLTFLPNFIEKPLKALRKGSKKAKVVKKVLDPSIVPDYINSIDDVTLDPFSIAEVPERAFIPKEKEVIQLSPTHTTREKEKFVEDVITGAYFARKNPVKTPALKEFKIDEFGFLDEIPFKGVGAESAVYIGDDVVYKTPKHLKGIRIVRSPNSEIVWAKVPQFKDIQSIKLDADTHLKDLNKYWFQEPTSLEGYFKWPDELQDGIPRYLPVYSQPKGIKPLEYDGYSIEEFKQYEYLRDKIHKNNIFLENDLPKPYDANAGNFMVFPDGVVRAVDIHKYGGKINKFAEGGDTNNTLLSREEYLNNKRQEIIDASLNNSRNRIEPTSPLIPMFESEEEWRDATTKELEVVNSKLSDSEFWINNIDLLYQRKDLIDRKKILEEELSKPYTTKYHKGASCIYTATDNYGKKYRVASNYQIHQNPEKYGFIRIDPNDAKPGDILQMGLSHAITYDHMGDDGHIIYNQSGGGSTRAAIGVGRRAANKGFDGFSSAYRFIGLQEDNDKWNSEYNNYRKDYSNNVVNTLKDVPTINTNITLEAPTRKLDGSENEQTLSGVRPITDTEKVEYVIRKSKGSTGDMKDPDNWGPLIRMGIAYGKEEVPVGWSVSDIPTKNDYTGAMMEGVGRMTDNNMGFVSTDDLVDELGYAPDDFVDAYTKNIIPFKELGVIEKTGSGEKKVLTKAIGDREVPVYQTHKDTLSSRDLKYLYGELEKAIPKKGDTIYSTNSTSPDSPFKIGNSNIYYDGNNHSVVQVKLPDGKTAFKALDYYDFNPDHWGYDVLPKAKEALQFLNDKGNPYVMTTPWYLQEDTRSIEDRLLDYGIEYNSDGTLYIGRDANGKKWSYEEALADIEKHPYL